MRSCCAGRVRFAGGAPVRSSIAHAGREVSSLEVLLLQPSRQIAQPISDRVIGIPSVVVAPCVAESS